MSAPPSPLIDAPYDGRIDERAWVPIEHAATPADAVAWCIRMLDYEVERLEDGGLKLVCSGARSWHVVSPCGDCDGSGADEYTGDARPFPACETCLGTGEQTYDECVMWEPCKPDTPGAIEFWDLEVVKAEQEGDG